MIGEDEGGAREREDGSQQHGSRSWTDTEGHGSYDGMAGAILSHQDHLTYLFAGRRVERRRAIKRWRPAEESGGRGDSNHGGQEEGGHGITLGRVHMIAMRRVCWELNDDDHDHPLYAVPRTHDALWILSPWWG